MRKTFGDRLLEMPDVTKYMLTYLDDEDLFKVCDTDPKFTALCNDYFWINRIRERYGLDINDLKTVSIRSSHGEYKEYYKRLNNFVANKTPEELLGVGSNQSRQTIVKIALNRGANPRIHNDLALYHAVANRNPIIQNMLLERIPKEDWGSIHDGVMTAAIYSNNMDMIRLLIDAGMRLRPEFLEEATRENNYEIVKLLLDAGIPADSDFSAALIAAKDPAIIKLLIDRGADHHVGNDSVFVFAVRQKNIDLIQYLAKLGINIRVLDDVIVTIRQDRYGHLQHLLPILEEARQNAV